MRVGLAAARHRLVTRPSDGRGGGGLVLRRGSRARVLELLDGDRPGQRIRAAGVLAVGGEDHDRGGQAGYCNQRNDERCAPLAEPGTQCDRGAPSEDCFSHDYSCLGAAAWTACPVVCAVTDIDADPPACRFRLAHMSVTAQQRTLKPDRNAQ
jgi:hypothetical protein